MDRFYAFLQEIYRPDPSNKIPAKTIVADFKAWTIAKYGPRAWAAYGKFEIYGGLANCPYVYKRYLGGRCLTCINYRNDSETSQINQPIVDQSIAGQPIADQPIADQSIAGQPIAGQPIADQPIAGQPIADQSIAGQPIAGQPIADQPTAAQPITGQSIAATSSNRNTRIRLVRMFDVGTDASQADASTVTLSEPQTLAARSTDAPQPITPPVPLQQLSTPSIQAQESSHIQQQPSISPIPLQESQQPSAQPARQEPAPIQQSGAPPPLRPPNIKPTAHNTPTSVPRRTTRRLHPPPPLPARPTGPVIYMAGQTELPDLDRWVRPFLYNADGTLKDPPPVFARSTSKTPAPTATPI